MRLVGMLALGAALSATEGGRAMLQLIGARLDDFWSTIVGVFT